MKKNIENPGPVEMVPLLIADVYELAGALRRRGEAIAATVGQTQARWQVLSAASVGGQTVAQLARRLGYARQSVQRTADQLVADGLARYANNPDHKKSLHLELTQPGEKALQALTSAANQTHIKLMHAAEASDLRATRRVVRALCAALDE